MVIDGAPWNDSHHRSLLPGCGEDTQNNLYHPSVFDFLSSTVNTVGNEDSSFTMSTSLKNETIPFPDLNGKPSFQPTKLNAMKLGGHTPRPHFYARGIHNRAVLAMFMLVKK